MRVLVSPRTWKFFADHAGAVSSDQHRLGRVEGVVVVQVVEVRVLDDAACDYLSEVFALVLERTLLGEAERVL